MARPPKATRKKAPRQRFRKPPPQVVDQATNAIRTVEASLESALGAALILQSLEDQYGESTGVRGDTDKLVAAVRRAARAAERTHKLGNEAVAERNIGGATGPTIQSGGGRKDP